MSVNELASELQEHLLSVVQIAQEIVVSAVETGAEQAQRAIPDYAARVPGCSTMQTRRRRRRRQTRSAPTTRSPRSKRMHCSRCTAATSTQTAPDASN